MPSGLIVKSSNEWLVVGRFGRPHGIKGYITVQSFTEPRDNILQYTSWCVSKGNEWVPLSILHTQQHNSTIVTLIKGYTEREQVAQLTNHTIAVNVEQLQPLKAGEYYWHQLIGLKVANTNGSILGTVAEIMATGSNDVLVVNGATRHLIPYRPGAVVIDVNLTQGLLVVDWDGEYL